MRSSRNNQRKKKEKKVSYFVFRWVWHLHSENEGKVTSFSLPSIQTSIPHSFVAIRLQISVEYSSFHHGEKKLVSYDKLFPRCNLRSASLLPFSFRGCFYFCKHTMRKIFPSAFTLSSTVCFEYILNCSITSKAENFRMLRQKKLCKKKNPSFSLLILFKVPSVVGWKKIQQVVEWNFLNAQNLILSSIFFFASHSVEKFYCLDCFKMHWT